MSKIYVSGLNANKIVLVNKYDDEESITVSDKFLSIPDEEITNIDIGWDYYLIWKNNNVYITGKIVNSNDILVNKLLQIPQCSDHKFKQVIAGSEKITVLVDNYDIWLYNIYSDTWEIVPSTFILNSCENDKEYVIKISQGRCTVGLTNFGRVFNIPISLNNPDEIKFVDIACGYNHTLLLAENGDIYSTGMGTRGELGHGDLEDCDEPKLIEALAGLKVIHISTYGWHSAVVTDQGDLYTWGWNNQGQLGQPNIENVLAVPTLVDLKDSTQKEIELNVIKAECGSAFTICQTDNGNLWGCGSNKYGQLGISRNKLTMSKEFILLEFDDPIGKIVDFKCREWSTFVRTIVNKTV
ncbi:RCC1 domain-containing protein 1 [Phymastichus coffea]|uniref:RCC1 domain-containing protein 1 n=1 Tax=Phymastichus coffea TaxID=108790 RepID=UPI00273ACF13|nr:RCC1 domain-containing protein 1 [Phymastichus coffea]